MATTSREIIKVAGYYEIKHNVFFDFARSTYDLFLNLRARCKFDKDIQAFRQINEKAVMLQEDPIERFAYTFEDMCAEIESKRMLKEREESERDRYEDAYRYLYPGKLYPTKDEEGPMSWRTAVAKLEKAREEKKTEPKKKKIIRKLILD